MGRWISGILLLLTLTAHTRSASANALALSTVQQMVRDGDIIFQQSRSAQSSAVQAATGSSYSHMGLVFGVTEGSPFVIEAVQPVRTTPLLSWINRGRNAHFVLMRVREKGGHDALKLRREAERFLGLDYDLVFDWSDERIYCSELVWKAYERAWGVRLGEPEPWRALHMDNAKVRALAKKRMGRLPDAEAPVITPARMMESSLLVRVLAGEVPAPRKNR